VYVEIDGLSGLALDIIDLHKKLRPVTKRQKARRRYLHDNRIANDDISAGAARLGFCPGNGHHL
jgi:hypothetical protein